MTTMYAIRTCRHHGQGHPSNKPDGSFIRQDGFFTDKKDAARLFDTVVDAENFIPVHCQALRSHGAPILPLFIVEVETKPVLAKVVALVKTY